MVWLRCRCPITVLGLEKALGEQVRLHSGEEPPAKEAPCAVVVCALEEGDVVRETARVGELAPEAPVLVFAQRPDLPLAKTALRGGARGFVHAGMEPSQIARALSVALEGELVAPRGLLEELAVEDSARANPAELSARQREVLELAVEGLSNAEAARRLFVSESTVKKHLRAAYRALGVNNRLEAAKKLPRDGR